MRSFLMVGRNRVPFAAACVATLALACGGEQSAEGAQSRESGPPTAIIVQPADGATLAGPDVSIEMAVQGISLARAGVDSANTGHLHLFINRDLTSEGELIPVGDGVVHFGLAQSEHVFEGLETGEYVVIVVLGDHMHVRIPGSQTDTVRITVQ